MKRILASTLFSVLVLSLFGQAKKPTIMVVPSDQMCNSKGYMQDFTHDGVTDKVADYKQAILDIEIANAIAKVNELMTERGFPLKDLQQTMKSITNMSAEDLLLQSKSGADIVESPIDKLRRTAKADIIMEMGWSVNKTGPKTTLTYTLRGLDAYTGKQIAGAQGTGSPSMAADIATLLEEAIVTNIDGFNSQLQTHFDDLFENGREVVVDIRVFDNVDGIDLEKEYGSDLMTLGEIIEMWMHDNTVNHRFSKTDATETFALYEQVRIPIYRQNGMAMDTESFVRELRRYLQKNFQIPSKIVNRGLGRSLLIIGDK